MSSQQFAVVVPIKPPSRGKSRLVGLPDGLRRELATAFALDTVLACLSADRVGAVLAVTDDVGFARALGDLGCAAIPDGVTGDLNGSLREGAAEAARRWPGLVPVALCADLPALLPGDLDEALAQAPLAAAAFVADTAGTGTTLYAAARELFDPQFGVESRAAHLEGGAVELRGDLRSLRRDVDHLADLAEARLLGLGRHTAALDEESRTE